jgi:hypothetical protein
MEMGGLNRAGAKMNVLTSEGPRLMHLSPARVYVFSLCADMMDGELNHAL